MARLIVKGSKKYTGWMKEHLAKEHPKTRGKMTARNGAGTTGKKMSGPRSR